MGGKKRESGGETEICIRRKITFETGHAMNRMERDGSSETIGCKQVPSVRHLGEFSFGKKAPPDLGHSASSLLSLP